MSNLEYKQEDEGMQMMCYEITSKTVEKIKENNVRREYALNEEEIAAAYGENMAEPQDYDEDVDPSGELTEGTLEAIESSSLDKISNGMTSD